MWCLVFRVEDLGCRVLGVACRAQGSGFKLPQARIIQ